MGMKTIKYLSSDWRVLAKFFPEGWRVKGNELDLLHRRRNIKSTSVLLRILMIHLAEGCSLRETATRAKEGGLANVSAVALQKKLNKNLSEWFRWMSIEMLKQKGVDLTPPAWLKGYRVKSVDASVITEPGSTGTDWRLHYSLDMYNLQCDQFRITRPEVGESFLNFEVSKGDLFIGDRAYGRLKGMNYVRENGGDYVVRLKSKAFTLYNKYGKKFSMTEEFSKIKIGQIREWKVYSNPSCKAKQAIRLCVIRKSKIEANKSIRKAQQNARKKQKTINRETIELHKYIIIATTLPKEIEARLIIELYRFRWQVEISFKRLKSIIGLGHLPKKNEITSCAWLHGKMFVALLAQAIVTEGRTFSPWGYRLG